MPIAFERCDIYSECDYGCTQFGENSLKVSETVTTVFSFCVTFALLNNPICIFLQSSQSSKFLIKVINTCFKVMPLF